MPQKYKNSFGMLQLFYTPGRMQALIFNICRRTVIDSVLFAKQGIVKYFSTMSGGHIFSSIFMLNLSFS